MTVGDTLTSIQPVTIGKIVHWFPYTGMGELRCRPAVVTNVPRPDRDDTVVWLYVFGGIGPHNQAKIEHGTSFGQWHWPAECLHPPHGRPPQIVDSR